jgi:hypothetical protein
VKWMMGRTTLRSRWRPQTDIGVQTDASSASTQVAEAASTDAGKHVLLRAAV